MTTRMSSREFNHDVSAAKRAARSGPVVITDRGAPSHVLLTFEAYEELQHPSRRASIVDLLRSDDDHEFDPGRAEIATRPVEL